MRKEMNSLFLFPLVMAGILTGMFILMLGFIEKSDKPNWTVEQQESVSIKNIHFLNEGMFNKEIVFDTNEGTIVMSMYSVHYIAKTEDESHMSMTVFKENDSERERAVLVVFINEEDLKLVSRNYAEAFNMTLTLDNVEPTITKLPDNYIDLSEDWDSEQIIE